MAGRSLNKACILGNVGRDPELRYTNNGKAVATFSIATSTVWRDQNGTNQEKTTWHNIVAWDKLAEICNNYVKKGKQVYVEGRIENRSYDDKDGNKKYVSEIVATDLILLGGGGASDRPAGGGYGGSGSSSQPAEAPIGEYDQSGGIPDSDLPF